MLHTTTPVRHGSSWPTLQLQRSLQDDSTKKRLLQCKAPERMKGVAGKLAHREDATCSLRGQKAGALGQ